MQFKDIVGQHEVKQRLIKSVKDDRIPHAQLFVGLEGPFMLALDRAYDLYLVCQHKV